MKITPALHTVGIAFLLLAAGNAPAQMGVMCSVVFEDTWGAAYSASGEDPCKTAHEQLKQKLRDAGKSFEFNPPFQIYIQSYYDESGTNEVYLNCEHTGGEYSRVFRNTGSAPIRSAIDDATSGSRMRCRISVKEDLSNARHPIVDRSMLGYCMYENDQGKMKMHIAKEGLGRDAACTSARQQMDNRPIVRRSGGYFIAAGPSKVGFFCLEGDHSASNTAYVSGFDKMVSLRDYLERKAVKGCVVTTDAPGDYLYGNTAVIVTPGFEE